MIRYEGGRSIVLALLLALGVAGAPVATAQVVDTYDYQPDKIYPVRTALGITTQIELSPNEKILDYSSGFSSGWDLVRRENVFYLKPKNVDVDTNLMVRTETHSYIFELKVVATDWRELEQARRAGVQYKIAFTYPGDAQFSTAQTAVEEEAKPLLSTGIAKDRHYNFDYSYATRARKSKAWLIPVSVYDDGRFTYLKLNDSVELQTGNFPAVFAREKEHSEDFVVNTTVEGNMLIVHGTYPYLVVRHGGNVVGLRRNIKK
jgi:type IV secretion system protein VirB9